MDTMDLMAHNAWDAYYNAMEGLTVRAGQRGVTVHASKYYKTFRSIAKMCRRRSLDVRDYVGMALSLLDKNTMYIIPKDIAKTEVMAAYLAVVKKRKGKTAWEVSWEQQESLLKLQMHNAHTSCAEDVLCRSSLAFEDWFRVLYDDPINEYIMYTYGQTAWNDMQNDPPLRRLLREYRPENIRTLQERFGYFGDPEDRII